MIYLRYTARTLRVKRICTVSIGALVFFSAQDLRVPKYFKLCRVNSETDTRSLNFSNHQTLALLFLPTALFTKAETNGKMRNVEKIIESLYSGTERLSPNVLKGDNGGKQYSWFAQG